MKRISFASCLVSSLIISIPAQAQICQETIVASATPTFFEVNQSYTLLDKRTSVIWSRCAHGQNWENQECIGSAISVTYKEARLAARNLALREKLAWRLPSVSELSLLVELRCHDPAIDLELFPNTPVGSFWTSTRFVNKTKHHWLVQFKFGANHVDKDIGQAYVRLVRDK